jgi:hypothetical protein
LEPRWIALIICLLIPVGLACAAISVQWRYRRLRSWKQATGRIETARSVAREVRSKRFRTIEGRHNTDFITDESIRTRNFAEVSYSFAVGTDTYRGNRIGLMGEPEGAEVAATLQRYPKGKTVTVCYNPANPNECVLERDAQGNIGKAGLAIALLVAMILAGFVAITRGADWLKDVVPNPRRVPLVIGLIVFSLVMILVSRMLTKQTAAMKKWPTTAGRIVRSEVETTVQHHRRPDMARDYDVKMYVPRVVYAYEVGGNSFEGDDIGWSASANRPSVAEKYVGRYPPQSQVQVFYDPGDPTQSTLAPAGKTLALVFWLIAGVLAGAAYAVGWLVP